ncbi:hypothetical protein [Fangia hongkongensis]|uniref:hypothetical protein n=1 Tax=Fangia hongkongensis TaxID=270495 RepID=UPI00035EF6AE|nr:hypothetical protein [Fangia hongkongensis]MBK2124423.1 hypothetical protein [Fangia hongkongensis]
MKVEKLNANDLYNERKMLDVCLLISKYTNDHAFFSYAPHTKSYRIDIYDGGFSQVVTGQHFTIYLGEEDMHLNYEDHINLILESLNKKLDGIEIGSLLLTND